MPVSDPDQQVLDALLTIVVADGDVDPDELLVASHAYESLTGITVDATTLQERAQARLDKGEASAFAPELGRGLADDDKHRILVAALSIAEADGFVLDEEDALLVRLEKALGLPDGAYRRAVERSGASR